MKRPEGQCGIIRRYDLASLGQVVRRARSERVEAPERKVHHHKVAARELYRYSLATCPGAHVE
jgi:hypothetical protein